MKALLQQFLHDEQGRARLEYTLLALLIALAGLAVIVARS
jgi:Flp pilus assembly pilin Flp